MHLIRQARAKSTASAETSFYLNCGVLFKKNWCYKILTIPMKYHTGMSSFTVFLFGTCQCEWAVIADRRFKSLITWWHCYELRPEPQNCEKCCSVFSKMFSKFSVTPDVIYSFSSQLGGGFMGVTVAAELHSIFSKPNNSLECKITRGTCNTAMFCMQYDQQYT